MNHHSWLVSLAASAAISFVSLFACISLAIADWQPGYISSGFSGGWPNCAIEFEGKLAVGGTFTSAGCAASPGVVITDFERFYGTGTSLWYEGRDAGSVNSLVVYDGQLIAGGDFDGRYPIMGIENVARFEGSKWVSLGNAPGDGRLRGGQVHELIVFDGDLIAVGDFTHSVVGLPLDGVARWDGEVWLPMGVKPPGAEALGVWNGELYCGLSRWDGSTWNPLGTTEPVNARVSTIDIVDDGLAFGGYFLKIGGANANGTAIYDGDTIRSFGGGARSTDDPYFEGAEYVPHGVRGFQSFGGETYLLAPIWTPSHGYFGLSKLIPNSRGGSNWLPVEAVTWRPHFLASGSFVDMGDRMGVVMGDGWGSADLLDHSVLRGLVLKDDQWSPLIPGKGTTEVPLAIASSGGNTWLALGTDGLLMESADGYRRVDSREYSGLDETTEGIITFGIADNSSPHVASFAAFFSAYSTLGALLFYTGLDPGGTYGDPQLPSAAVQWDAGYLVAAGFPYVFGYQTLYYFADLGGSVKHQWMNGPVFETADALIIHQGQPWLATDGQVYRIDGNLETGTTSILVGTFNGPVNALVSEGDKLIAGGDFDSVNSVPARNLAAWAGSQWSERMPFYGPVNALACDNDGVVYAGGDFSRVGPLDTRNLAVLRDDIIGPFPDGPNGPVEQIALTDQGFIISGPFSSVGGYCANNLAEWIGPGGTVSVSDRENPSGETPRITALRLLAPIPNPFNPRVTISFELPRASTVQLRVYDLAGRLVKTLANEQRESGVHALVWDGTDDTGRAVASGVYLAALIADGRSVNQKMALVR